MVLEQAKSNTSNPLHPAKAVTAPTNAGPSSSVNSHHSDAAAHDDEARRAVPLLRDRTVAQGAATAYLCEGFTCRLPVTDPAALAAQLDEALGP